MFAKKLIVLFVVAAIFSGVVSLCYADVVVMEDFESYDVNTIMDDEVGGWDIQYGSNSNLSSPIVKDGNSYTAINGQFWKMVDDNSENIHPEVLAKSTPITLSQPGDYVQMAVYASSETVDGNTPSGQLAAKLRDASGHNIAYFGIGWRYWQAGGENVSCSK